MAPSPQENLVDETRGDFIPRPMESLTDEAVVITGMSGIFPNSDSVNEFMENLYNKVDMVSTENARWVYDHPELPKHFGKINGMEKFDAQFFRVHYKQACIMEPMSRKLLEHAYGAIYDAGLNPLQLRGKKVGVFIGSTTSESEKIVIYETIQRNGFGITGCNKAMYANRISYWIDGKGPSYALDLAGASSMACLEHAYRNISKGLCDAAIIGGCNFVAHPTASLNVKRAGYLCLDGKTKCFDQNGDGYVRSDAISVLFIQKAKDAKRVYAEVIGSKMNYATKPDPNFLPIREPKEIQEFLEAFYSNVGVAPEDVEYVEANGSGNATADGNEVEAIGKVFGKRRPVNIGSVTSNMGNSEPASGVCALTKVCLAYHQGALPGNLHLYTPHAAVREGSVRVVQETTAFDRGYVAVNSFSTTGINIHALLKGHFKPKQQNRYKTNLPYLVLVSARTEGCLKEIFDIMKKLPLDPEWIGLMHNIHSTDIPGHMGRGYIILDKSDSFASSVLAESASYCDGTLPPVWFVYSGMGSQWPAMGRELMKIPIFAAAIEKCRLVLEPKGVDIVRILTDPDKTIYDNILHSFVGIAAVQIGLTDILKEMGIVPDNIIGHSVGELGCAYAAGSFTAEQMVLAALARGRVSLDAGFSRGSMAAVGLGYQEVLPLCPPEIQVACHNSAESSTISGPAEAMKTFVAELTSKGIFAKEVPCSNIAYHSKYIASAGPELLRYLSEIIPEPQLRGDKWVSTSVPKDRWDEDAARYSSAEYHTNNLLNPVLFEETAEMIPENALVIEIAPHGLLQAILRRSHATCRHIPLTRRGHKEPVKFLLESIGKLFEANLNPKVDVLYPKIQFPVSTETPMLSNLVKWEHSEDWYFVQFNSRDRKSIMSQKAVMSAHDDDFKYFKGHVIDGINIYPESAILVFVWETFAMYKEKKCKDMSVVFKEVKFDGDACITDGNVLTMEVRIQKGNNQFEVSLFETKIASGFIYEATPSDLKQRPIPTSEDNQENIQISSDDIYNIFEMKGSSYKNEFRSIESMNITRDKANIIWNENWSVFLNGMLQLNFLAKDYDGISKPKYIQNLKIDVDKHNEEVMKNDGKFCKAEYFDTLRVTRCGGVELFNVILEDKRQQNPGVEVLETQAFVPHLMNGIITMESAMNINLQILSQNTADKEIQILNSIATTKPLISAVLHKSANQSLDNIFKIVLNDLPTISSDIEITKSDLIVMSDVISNEERKRHLFNKMSKKSFLLLIEDNTTIISEKIKYFNIISRFTTQHNTVLLLNKQCDVKDNLTYVQVGSDKEVDWVPKVRNELEKSKQVVIVSWKHPYFKLSGIVKDFKKTYGNRVRLIVVNDETAPPFNPNNEMYAEQLQRQITISVLHKGHWGGYYYIPCPNTAYLHNFKLTSSSSGDIDNLTWVESPPLSTEQNNVRVQYAGLSSRDIQVAVGLLTGDGELVFGMDFSGVDSANNRVFGLIQSGSIASSVEADSALLWPVPQHWSLEDAATVALPYVMAYYCLGVQASLNASGAILVVGGGHLAHAVLSIGLSLGCRVFAAVPDAISRDLIRRLFPELPESHIGNSGDDSFVEMIALQTQSKRCDFVINCASGAIREAAMKCVGMLGYFMDTSEIDMKDNQNFGMYHLTEEKSYKAIRVSNIFDPENRQQRKKLQRMLSEGISSGAVRPLPRLKLPATSGVHRAARLIAGRRVPARVLLEMSPAPSVEPRMEFDSVGSYVVICDNNNVGLELADRLVKKGAKNIVLHLNPQSIGGLLHMKLLSWKKYKANVQVYFEELKTGIDCKNLLMNAQQLGSVKGIFFVPSKSATVDIQDTNYERTSAIVENFDKISSDLCPELRYFVSLAATAPAAAACIESRVRRKLPALCLHYQGTEQLNLESKAFSSKRERQTLSSVLDSLEVCLKLQYTNVRTSRLKKKLVVDVSQKLAEIIGIKNLNDVDENLTLQNLCLTEINVEEIRSLLKEFHGFDYTPSTVLKLTLAELRTTFIPPPIDGSTGGMLHSWVDADECAASEPLVVMTTRLSSANESEEELDYSEAYLFMIPGFEGHNKIFASICERLKIKALTLQLAPDLDNESIPVIAENMYKNLKKRFELKSNFYLFGYSFGVNVALELAALLESFGHVGVVCCLGSSPAALRCQLSTDIGEPSPQLENHLIQHIYKLMAGKHSDQLTRDLNEIADWSDKVDLFIQRLRGAVRYSHQYKRLVLESTYQRIKLAYEYEPDFKLKSRIVLLKGTEVFDDEALNHDYGLSKYTTQPVEVHQLSSAHASTPWDPKVSNIVNQFLEPSLIEEFKTKNLCETYLAPKLKMI